MSVEFWKNLLKLKQEEEGEKQEEEKEPEKRNLIYVDIIEKEKWGIGETASLLLEFDWNDDILAYVAEWESTFRKPIYLEYSTFITLSEGDNLRIIKMLPNNIFSEKEKERISQKTNGAVYFENNYGNSTIIKFKVATIYNNTHSKLAKEGREKISKDWEYLNFLATNFENYVNKLIDDRR